MKKQTASESIEHAATNYTKSIELMNRAIGLEIATSLQYMYFHATAEDAGYHFLAKMWRRVGISEMRHIEELAERILFLKGEVDMNPSFRTKPLHGVEEMLSLAFELERSTIDRYNAWAKEASEHSDAATHTLFRRLIEEEERHMDTFDIERENLRAYGKEYLALQSIAHAKAEERDRSPKSES